MSLKQKNILIFISLFIFVFLFMFLITNNYMEKFYIWENNRQIKSLLSNDLEFFENYEKQDIVINIFEYTDDERIFNDRLRLGFHDKKLNLTRIWLIEERLKNLSNKYEIINYSQPNLQTSILVGIKKQDKKVISLAKPLPFFDESIKTLNKFNLIIFLFSLIIIILVLFLYSNHLIKKINKINKQAKNIYDLKFDYKPYIKGKDELSNLSFYLNDVSENLEKSINELNNRVDFYKEMIDKQKQYVSSLGHELKTPLTVLKSYTHRLNEKNNQDDLNIYINNIIEESDNLNDLISLFLNFIKYDYYNLDLKENDINEILNEVINRYAVFLEDKQLILDTFSAKKKVDRDLIKIVFDNLVSNAIKYGEKEIKIEFKNINDDLIISFINKGKIKEKDIESIFEPFYRIDKSRNKKVSGHGLGLSIANEIIKKHNGLIKVKNDNRNIVFSIIL
ncbi:MAG: sensor histidine kinase [Thermotogota bacterium]